MRFSKSIILSAIAIVTPLIGSAATITSHPTLSVADLTFSNFGCTITKEAFATPGSCSKINVNTTTTPGNGIQISSGFTAIGVYPVVSFDDAVIHFNVSSATGIDTVGLDFNGTWLGLAVSSVTESVYHGSDLVGFLEVSCNPFEGCDRSESIKLNGVYNDLTIKKDINVSAFAGLAQISFIDQTFSLSSVATPEPSSIALLGSGLVAGACALRRRRKLASRK